MESKKGATTWRQIQAVLVDADSCLLEVLRYIHTDPLRAVITEKLSDFGWSSHQGYKSKAKKWEWLHKVLFTLHVFPKYEEA